MRTAALVLSALFVLGGCATQEPVKVVDAVCDSASCMGQLADLRQKSRAELDAGNAARLAAEDCRRQKVAVEQQLQTVKGAQAQAEKSLAEQAATLARCQGTLATLQEKAKADAVASEAMRQELLQKAKADAAASEALRQELLQKARTDAAANDALRQELQKYTKIAEGSAKQLQRMKDLEERLRERLQSDIGSKDVEIERLRSKLSVRVLDRILFESGSADILPQGRGVLDSVATVLEEGDETIRIEGHTDIVPIGPELKKKYFSNWELSTARASSVARFFLDHHGLEPTRMEAVGYSKFRPIAPNDSVENRQRNRRVEIVLTPWKPEVEEAP